MQARRGLLLAAALAWCTGAAALGVTYTTPLEAAYNALLSSPTVPKVLGDFGTEAPLSLRERQRIAALPAGPAGARAPRAQYALEAMRRMNLEGAAIDSAGNVVGERRGLLHRPRLMVVASLHPGDEARGLGVMLTLLRTMQAQRMQTVGDVVFVAVAEAKGGHEIDGLLRRFKDVDGFISIDDDARAGAGIRPAAAASPVSIVAEAASRAAQLMTAPAPMLFGARSFAAAATAAGVPAASMPSGATGGLPPAGTDYQPAGEWKGPQSLLLTALALSGLAGISEPLLEPRKAAPVKRRALR